MQNSPEMCLIHLQGCIQSSNISNIFKKKLQLKLYNIEKKEEKSPKKEEGGNAKLVYVFTRPKTMQVNQTKMCNLYICDVIFFYLNLLYT